MGSGCGDLIVEKSFVLRANSPSRWHLTRGLLLCSGFNIHDFWGNVNRYLPIYGQLPKGTITVCQFSTVDCESCRRVSIKSVPVSPCFPYAFAYNGAINLIRRTA